MNNELGYRYVAVDRDDLNREFSQRDSLAVENFNSSLPEAYTVALFNARRPVYSSFQKSVKQELGSYFSGDILEVGPGARRFLYQIAANESVSSWHAIDVSTAVIQALQDRFSQDTSFSTEVASVRNYAPDRDFDVVCGLASLDGLMDYHDCLQNVWNILKPGGYFIHIQDITPCGDALLKLLLQDPAMEIVDEFVLLGLDIQDCIGEESFLFTHVIGAENTFAVEAHSYLTKRIEEIGATVGFNRLIRARKNLLLPADEMLPKLHQHLKSKLPAETLALSPLGGYSYLLMQKPK